MYFLSFFAMNRFSLLGLSLFSIGCVIVQFFAFDIGQATNAFDFLWWLFVHTSWFHLGINLVGLWLLWFLYPQGFTGVAWFVQMTLCGVIANTLYVLIHGQDIIALGLSGALHGLAWLLGTKFWSYTYSKFFIGALVGKIMFEQFVGRGISDDYLQIPILIDCHLYGVIGGIWLMLLQRIARRSRIYHA